MSKIPAIKFSDMKVEKFLDFITRADIQEMQVIDFTPQEVKCKAHPSDKSFIKYTAVEIPELMKYDSTPDDFELLKLPLYKLKRVKDALTIYIKRGIDTINGEIGYDSEKEGDGSHTGLYIRFKSPKMDVKIKATEMYMVKYMEDKHWEIYSNMDNPIAKFEMDKNFVTQVSNLCNLEGDDNVDEKEKNISIIINVLKSDDKIVFRSKDEGKWHTEYGKSDGNLNISGDKDYTFFVPQKAIQSMTAPSYNVYIVENKRIEQYIMVMYENKDNIMVKGLMEHEEDF